MKIDDPVCGNIDFKVSDDGKITTTDTITIEQGKYLKANEQALRQKILLADFHQCLREAGCNWI